MEIRIAGKPLLTITGADYSASVSVVAWENGWPVEQTTITVTGQIAEANLAANFLSRLKTAAGAWRVSFAAREALQAKLAGLEGKSL